MRLDILINRLNSSKNRYGSFKDNLTPELEKDILVNLKHFQRFVDQRLDVDIKDLNKYA